MKIIRLIVLLKTLISIGYSQPETIKYFYDDNEAIIRTVINDSTTIFTPVDETGNRTNDSIVGSPGNPMPVELTSFTAKGFTNPDKTRYVQLDWVTKMEENNEGFNIEWLTDSQDWQFLDSVMGYGNSISTKTYQYFHRHPEPKLGNNYYRLKQKDHDGTHTYTKVVVVHFGDQSPLSFRLYPNPTSGNLTIEPLGEGKSKIISITDAQGRNMEFQATLRLKGGWNVKTEGFLPGIYIITIRTEHRQKTQLRFIVK